MLNLASKARPYFGAVVLTTCLLTAGGIYSATLMPSGVYPEVTFPRVAVVAKCWLDGVAGKNGPMSKAPLGPQPPLSDLYVGIIGLMVRWFPDKRGFATGMEATPENPERPTRSELFPNCSRIVPELFPTRSEALTWQSKHTS